MSIDVEVEASAWTDALPDVVAVAERAAAAALEQVDREVAGVTVLLTDDATVADLNTRFRSKAGPTNVLSFPSPANPENHLGDLALAFETCAREAAEQNNGLEAHLSHLTAHGVLHLLGFDHEDDAEADVMEATERAALARLGLPDPYASERAE